MELHQRSLFESRSFFLLDNRLKLYLKDTVGEYENYISYENIKTNILIYQSKSHNFFFLALFLSSFSASIFLYGIFNQQNIIYAIFIFTVACCLGIIYKCRQPSYLIIETIDNKKIVFFNNKPSKESLHLFLISLWQYRKRYLRKKYFYLNLRNNMQQEVARLRWLLEQKAITHDEFILAKEDWIVDRIDY